MRGEGRAERMMGGISLLIEHAKHACKTLVRSRRDVECIFRYGDAQNATWMAFVPKHYMPPSMTETPLSFTLAASSAAGGSE